MWGKLNTCWFKIATQFKYATNIGRKRMFIHVTHTVHTHTQSFLVSAISTAPSHPPPPSPGGSASTSRVYNQICQEWREVKPTCRSGGTIVEEWGWGGGHLRVIESGRHVCRETKRPTQSSWETNFLINRLKTLETFCFVWSLASGTVRPFLFGYVTVSLKQQHLENLHSWTG